MNGRTSGTMYGIVHRFVLEGCVIEERLLNILW